MDQYIGKLLLMKRSPILNSRSSFLISSPPILLWVGLFSEGLGQTDMTLSVRLPASVCVVFIVISLKLK